MGAPQRRARNAARDSFSGGWRRTDWKRVWSRGQNAAEFPTKFLGKADMIDIFAFEEFPNESGRKPLSLAQIRYWEVPVSLFSPKHRPSETPKHLFHPPHVPRNPHFPALRSGRRLFQRHSPQKQFPSNTPTPLLRRAGPAL